MEYLKIDNIDFSMYVNELNITKNTNYNAQTNAAGDTVIDYINAKRQLEIGIIPLDNETMKNLLNVIDRFSVSVSFLNPYTGTIDTMQCIIPENEIEYFTIQANNISFNGFSITCIEL